MSSKSFKVRAEIAESKKAKTTEADVTETYHVTLLRPDGVSVSEMNALIKMAIMDCAWGHAGGIRKITQHPIKVQREPATEVPYRKTAILHD